MAYPPSVPVGTRINTTPQVNTHAADHNTIHAALADIINEMGANPSGGYASIDARLTTEIPIGVPMMWLTGTPPSGHEILDGEPISRADNPVLFSLWGTTYGAGDGSLTFNKPDLRNKFVVGAGSTGFTATLNVPGGSKDAVAVAHTHAHTHGIDHDHASATTSTAGEHNHNLGNNTQLWYQGPAGNFGGWTASVGNAALSGYWNGTGYTTTYNATAAGSHDHTLNLPNFVGDSSQPEGVSQSPTASGTNANLPPFFPVNFIVRLG